MPKPGFYDGTEAQVVLEPSSFARELAASARAWADALAKIRAEASTAVTTTATATPTAPPPPQPPQPPPLAEARGRDPRSALPGAWVRVRVVDSCAASGPEGGLRFCVEIENEGRAEGRGGGGGEGGAEKRKQRRRRRWWLPLAWTWHPSSVSPALALRPLSPTSDSGGDDGAAASWTAGDEAEVGRGGGGGGGGGEGGEGGAWWPATVLEVKDGGGGAGTGETKGRTLVARIEPCCCYPTGAVVSIPLSAGEGEGGGSSLSVRRKPPLPPLFEEEAARLQLEQERAERSGRLGGGGFGSRGGVLGSGRRWSGMATSFGESVHPEEWRRRTAGLLAAARAVVPAKSPNAAGRGENGEKGEGEGAASAAAAGAAAAAAAATATATAAGPSAGDSSGARTHLIAGFSMEAALCPGQLSTATREEEEGEEGEEGEEEEKAKEGGDGEGQQQQLKKKRRKVVVGPRSTDRDPFDYDGAARALLAAGGSL